VPEAEPEAAPAADEELEDAVRAIGDRVVSLAEEVEAELMWIPISAARGKARRNRSRPASIPSRGKEK
jgi:hypothetical protein